MYVSASRRFLVPGFTGSKEDFIPVLRPLASAGRIITAIDMRGQYQSPAAAGQAGYTPDELATDIAAVADAIAPDDEGVHLLGHSLGGLVARHAVLAKIARIASLTLLSSGPGHITGPRREALMDMLGLLSEADNGTSTSAGAGSEIEAARLRSWAARLWDEHLGPQAQAEGVAEHIITFLRERHFGTSPAGLVVMGNYLLSCPDQTDQLARIEGLPILVVYGENDNAWPPQAQDLMGRKSGPSGSASRAPRIRPRSRRRRPRPAR